MPSDRPSIDCVFDSGPDGLLVCRFCGRPTKPPPVGELHRNCRKPPALEPAAERLGVSLADVGNYAQALARWMAAGFPTRNDEEVDRIHRELCQPCEHYRDGRCAKCRCRVTGSRLAVVNKVKMGNESCPVGKW